MNIEELMLKMSIDKLDEKLEKFKKCGCLSCITLAMQIEQHMEQLFTHEELLCLDLDK